MVKTRKGDKACNLAAVSRDLLHFKLELTQKYWKSRRNGDGSMSWPNLRLIPPTVSELGRGELWYFPSTVSNQHVGLPRQPAAVFPPFKSARGSQALIGRFETTCIPWIPLVAEFCTDHIEKAIFVTLASIFSETVGGMSLKFGFLLKMLLRSLPVYILKQLFFSIWVNSGRIFTSPAR